MPHLIPNHHHGEAGLEDAGYFKVNGKWVDPDSEHELHAAFTGTAVEKSPELPLSNKGGPKTMNWEEQEEYYKWYIAEVTDCDDREGDPRVQGISSQTFKAWACGAVKGDKYVTEQVPPQVRQCARAWMNHSPEVDFIIGAMAWPKSRTL